MTRLLLVALVLLTVLTGAAHAATLTVTDGSVTLWPLAPIGDVVGDAYPVLDGITLISVFLGESSGLLVSASATSPLRARCWHRCP
jgi:hypothetical protein